MPENENPDWLKNYTPYEAPKGPIERAVEQGENDANRNSGQVGERGPAAPPAAPPTRSS